MTVTTHTWLYTSTGTEPLPSVVISQPCPVFTGAFTVSLSCDGPQTNILNWHISLTAAYRPQLCWDDLASMLPGNTSWSENRSVGDVPSTWHCTDWNYITLSLPSASDRPAAGLHWTLSITADFVPATICTYGTQKNNGAQTALEVGFGLLDLVGLTKSGAWAIPMVLANVATPIILDQLCGQNPPGDPPIGSSDWTTPSSRGPYSVGVAKVTDKFITHVWNTFCQCTPAPSGSPPPTPPAPVDWTQPTSYVTNNNITITETQLSVAIQFLIQIITGTQGTNTTTAIEVQKVLSCACPGAYIAGTVHVGLTGEGSFPVSGLSGLLIEVVAKTPGAAELAGNPPYLWNAGWMSIDNADGMLEEKRVTRDAFVWLPAHMGLATSFNYYLLGATELRVTELEPS